MAPAESSAKIAAALAARRGCAVIRE
jgi:hypothetical protein